MKNILIVSFAILLGIAGCTAYKPSPSSTECIGCERLRTFWKNLEEQNIQNLVFFDEDSNEPIDEVTLKEFREGIPYIVGCYEECRPYPPSCDWVECYSFTKEVWKCLEKEKIRKIVFCKGLGCDEPPENWKTGLEIIKPERIRETMKLIRKAKTKTMKKEERFANWDAVGGSLDRMRIITNVHKFIIHIYWDSEEVRGVDWTSYKLSKKLKEWGFPEPK